MPKRWNTGSEVADITEFGSAQRYVNAYDRGWWIGVQKYIENINFDDQSPLIVSGWAAESSGSSDGYDAACVRIVKLIRVYGKKQVSNYLQQFKLPSEK